MYGFASDSSSVLFSLTFISFCLRIVSHSLDQCLNSFPISFTVQWKWYNLMTNFATVFLVFLFSITLSIGLFHRNVDQTKSENVFTLNIHGIGSVRIRLLNCFLSHLGHWFHDFRVDAITYRHNQIMFGIIYAYRHVFGLFAYWVNGFILLVVWRLTIFDRWAWMSVSFSYFRFSFWCVFLKVMVPFTVFFFVFSFERWSTQTHKFSLHSIMEWFRWACVPTLNTIKFKWNIFLFILGVFFFVSKGNLSAFCLYNYNICSNCWLNKNNNKMKRKKKNSGNFASACRTHML